MAPRRGPLWPSLAILVTGLLSAGPIRTLAQTSTAVCLSSFNWMDNSKTQNPCLVAAYLQGACNGGQFTVDPLPVGTHYTGPYADEQNQCQCSSVTYDAISACGLCQNRTIISWSSWNLNCSTVYVDVFPPSVPDGTAIPQWMFQDVTTSDLFNATLAQSVGDNPESTASHVQSTGVVTPTVASASLTSSPTTTGPADTSSPTSSGSSTNTGAIAGGVVGGVVGVALIAGVIVFFAMRKKRSQIPPSAQFTGIPGSPPSTSPGYTDTTSFVPQMVQPRLYDPSDPSTFPASPPPATIMTTSSHNIQNPGVNYSASSMRPGTYSGMPEV